MRVILADDSILVRAGIARLLTDRGLEVVGEVGTARDLLDAVRRLEPDVVVVDIRMPPSFTDEGLQAARTIGSEFAGRVGVLILSQHLEPAFATELLSSGGSGIGYLLKDRILDLDDFADAVRRVGQGGSALDASVVAQLLGAHRAKSPIDDLTEREREVLALMAEGRSNQGIAGRMFLSPKTVEANIGSIFSKLGLLPATDDHRRVLAVVTYLQAGA